MCIGIPMQVVECRPGEAVCLARDSSHLVDTALVGDVAPGTWLMVFLGAARDVLSPETAKQTADALEALHLVLSGETDLDHLFSDLVGREPQLPEHLREPAAAQPSTEASAQAPVSSILTGA